MDSTSCSMRKACFSIAIIVCSLAVPRLVLGGTYYIAASGSDSNNGTAKTTPWLHAPGMPSCSGTCAGHTPTAGDQFIFRGGDTWHFGNSSAAPFIGNGGWSWSGWSGTSSSNMIYIGVDQTWYSGSSWARPILTADNPTSTSAVSSCAYRVGGSGGANQMVVLNGVKFIQFDNFEMTGLCWNDTGTGYQDQYINHNGASTGNSNGYIISNVYIHGWTHTAFHCGSGACGGAGAFEGYNQAGGVTLQYNVVDGSDSDDTTLDTIFADGYIVQYNVIRHVGGSSVPNNCHLVHDNLFEYINNSSDGAEHSDVLMCYGEAGLGSSSPNMFYNNVFRYIGTEHSEAPSVSTLWLFPPSGQTDYVFNNVVHDIYSQSNYFSLNQGGGPGGGNMTMYNNTMVNAAIGCTAGGSITAVNNQWVGISGSAFNCSVTESSALYMPAATASSQGYTSANDYAPTLATNSTVGAGANLTSSCTTLPALCSGTGTACSYNSTSHTVSCPGTTVNARPSSGAWDTGAYEFKTGTTQSTPPSTPPSVTVLVH